MAELNHEMVEALVRQIVAKKLMSAKQVDPSGTVSIRLSEIDVTENGRLDTGNPADIVYTKDLFSLEESPRLGCSLMMIKDATLDWTLKYDKIDYIISGQLDTLIDGCKISATAGEIILIPKGSKIQLSVTGSARFVCATYPVDWQSQ